MKKKMLKMLKVNNGGFSTEVVEVLDHWEALAKEIGADYIEFYSGEFLGNGKVFVAVLDEEGLLKEGNLPSVMCVDKDLPKGESFKPLENLVGTLLICGEDEEDPAELASITDEEIEALRELSHPIGVSVEGNETIVAKPLCYTPKHFIR